ncbi:hypothetical protein P775_17810 [Puniceibacterium antarcticum]|uniref:Uncharacterized protein n=1 Tax=Puniceibacterium antarcticum TaxID=1206336 RepID=A0A2G8RBH6_9RHOB|nr:hypothetical protein P775_17810 [Puniceibacterium antarcticum]
MFLVLRVWRQRGGGQPPLGLRPIHPRDILRQMKAGRGFGVS